MRKWLVTSMTTVAVIAAWAWLREARDPPREIVAESPVVTLSPPLPDPELPLPTSSSIPDGRGPASREVPPVSTLMNKSAAAHRRDLKALANEHERLMRDPAFRQAALDARRTEYAGARADLVRALRITPAQADRIIDYWAARDLIHTQAGLSTAAAPDLGRLQAINERAAEEILAEERALRESVGDVADRLRDYEAARVSRIKVDALRAQAGKAGEPVPEEHIEPQLDQFERLLAEQLAIERARVEMLAARAALTRDAPGARN